jgi:hypothetical protein
MRHPTVLFLAAAIWSAPSLVLAQTTRAEVLEQERANRANELKPYEPGRIEKLILNAEEGKLRRMIAPHNGFFVEYGYSYKPVGSGIGFGGGFRHDLFDRRARVVFEAGETFRRYRMIRADFALPRLAGERLEVGVEGLYRKHTQDDFYGIGPHSRTEDRASFGFEAKEFRGRAIVTVRPWLSVGTRLGRMSPSIGSGTDDRFPSVENLFDDAGAPGLAEEPNFTYGDAFAEVDYRDEPGNARAGGHYLLTVRKYFDGDLDRFSFRSVDLLLQHFVPIFDKKRVFAFQFGVTGTDADAGHRVPFYMQPTLGGSRTLRSAADYRFRDTHALWLNAEYRWEAFSALDMALFTDWGKVAGRASDLDLSDLEHAYGIGFRFNTAKSVLMRFDIAAGGSEGVQYLINFSNVF